MDEADFVLFITGSGIADDDGDKAFAQAAEHEEDIVEYLSVVVLGQVVGMIEIWGGHPGIEQAGESPPVVPVGIDAAERFGRRIRHLRGCGGRDGIDVCP